METPVLYFPLTARLQILTPLYLTKFTLPCVAVHVSYFYSMTASSILRGKERKFLRVSEVFLLVWNFLLLLLPAYDVCPFLI